MRRHSGPPAAAALAHLDQLIDSGRSAQSALQASLEQFPDQAALISDALLQTLAGSDAHEDAGAALSALYDAAAARVSARLRAQSAFPGIAAQAERLGITLPDLAARIRIALSVVRKIDQRMISFASIPEVFLDTLAAQLDVQTPILRSYIAGAPKLAASADYKSNKPPRAARRQTFEEALRSSVRTGEMQQLDAERWLSGPGR